MKGNAPFNNTPLERTRREKMKLVVYIVSVAVYIAAVFYLLMGTLGFGLGFRISGNNFAEAGVGFHRTTYLALLLLLLCGGFYVVWRINRRPI